MSQLNPLKLSLAMMDRLQEVIQLNLTWLLQTEHGDT